ncbi:hypothetical protein B0H10DRAFT_714594 [Mycena sp. CBHHK59/15]|nr:hypothetical protein B0H10DRAFT_714594 [Mycena sp. CBHHK59/15]
MSPLKLSKAAKRNSKKQQRKKKEDREKLMQRAMLGTELDPEELEQIQHCPNCENEPMDDRCIRTVEVWEQLDVESLMGATLTCAPVGDRLKPLPPPKRQKKSKALPPRKARRRIRIRYINPETLGLRWVGPRDHIQKKCGRDITRFVYHPDQGGPQLVGGVRYNALEPTVLERLTDNHRRVKVRGVRRREEIHAWNYGSMTASGSRQPAGGIKGDGYAPYTCHTGDTPDDIKALFRHAVDTDVLVEVGSTIAPTLRSDIAYLSSATGENRLGRYSLSSFYCTNYISAIHPDGDIGKDDVKHACTAKHYVGGLYPCIQLVQKRTNKGLHEWDFAMVQWGIVIETWANTVWIFNGRHGHGSVLPSQSSYNNGAMSSGIHPTKRARDAARAQAIQQIRLGMGLRPCV